MQHPQKAALRLAVAINDHLIQETKSRQTTPVPDTAWQTYRSLTLAYESGVIEKLLFGSDFPTHTVKNAAEALYNINKITLDSVLPAVPREQVRSIVERNSLELLGLSIPEASSASVEPDSS